jgi:hypothetical protein
MNDDVSKDLVFEEPRVPNKYGKEPDATQPRGYWTVAEVEAAMWRTRASGGTDSTPIKFTRGPAGVGGNQIRAEHVEAFPIEVPPRYPEPPPMPPGDDPRAGRRIPSLLSAGQHDPLPKPVRYAAQTVGVLLVLPPIVAGFLYVYGWFFGLFF